MDKCLQCDKPIEGRRIKYCSDRCQSNYLKKFYRKKHAEQVNEYNRNYRKRHKEALQNATSN